MSKNILVDAYNLTKILTSIRKYRKRATSIDMLIDVALISAILCTFVWIFYMYYLYCARYEAQAFINGTESIRT